MALTWRKFTSAAAEENARCLAQCGIPQMALLRVYQSRWARFRFAALSNSTG